MDWEAEATRLGELLDKTAGIVEDACEALGDAGGDLVELARVAAARAKRCPVTAEDVRDAGLTWEKFDAWAEAHGFAPARRPNSWDTPKLKIIGRSDIGWVRGDTFYGEPAAWPGNRRAYGLPGQVARFIMFVSETDKRPAFDILDEMAAEASP